MKNLFFKNRFSRKVWLLSLKAKLIKPFDYLKAIWKMIKFYRDYPDRWERYVKMKEEEKRYELWMACSNFIVEAHTINFCQLMAINQECTEEQKNIAEFQQSRKELQKLIKELNGYDIIVPKGLKSYLLETPIDRFGSLEEWEMVTDSFNEEMKLVIDSFNKKMDNLF